MIAAPAYVRIAIGSFRFDARLETENAPHSVAALCRLLPLQGATFHARWSGEAAWLPLTTRLELQPENATAHPRPGQVLLYGGNLSEPELLIPYGACAFACRAGELSGNHVLTIENDLEDLRELGRLLLWEGAQRVEVLSPGIHEFAAAAGRPR